MKKKMSILAALVLAVVVTGYSVSGTYAKYTSTIEGATSTARVAKWAVKVGDKTQSDSTSFTFDLFNTINDTKGGAEETDVKKGTGENIIAPGTTGSFDIVIQNLSEVTANYAINYTVTNNIAPVKFSVDNGTTWTDTLANVVAGDTTKLAIANDSDDTDKATITVMWKWDFEQSDVATGDEADTALGTASTLATVSVKADVTVTQVD